MTKINQPDRIYLLSDTYGGHRAWDPFRSPDIDALITTNIRARLQGVLLKEFDIFGAENITDHILRTAVNLHEENPNIGTTGIFINSAPRTKKGQNGEPFYLAETNNGLRIAATPLEVLSAIKPRIIRLRRLPNDNNGLYGPDEQFRSSFTPRLITDSDDLPLEEDNPLIIPDYNKNSHVSYVDRFGNIIIFDPKIEETTNLIRKRIGEVLEININGIEKEAKFGNSLAESEPGALSVYNNNGNIEIVTKWNPAWDSKKRLKYSAYEQFKRPKIGSKVSILL